MRPSPVFILSCEKGRTGPGDWKKSMAHTIVENVETSGCSRKLVLEIPREDFKQEIEKGFETVRQNVALPGFRKGKAPIGLLRKRFAKEVESDALQKLVGGTIETAVKELELHVVGEPNLADLTHENDDPVRFSLEVEFIPDFPLGEYRNHGIEIEPEEVKESQVGDVLERLRERAATLSPVEGRAAEKGHVAHIKVDATANGVPLEGASHAHYPLEIGLDRHLPGFEEAIVGMNVGDSKTVDLTLPDDYQVEDAAGKAAAFTIELLELKSKELPALDDEFARDLGPFENIGELKDRVRHDLAEEASRNAYDAARHRLEDQLIEQHTEFALPPSLVEGRRNYIGAMRAHELQRMGLSEDQLGTTVEERERENQRIAERQTRLSLLLDRIARDAEVAVTEDEYLQFLIHMSQSSGQNPEFFLENITKRDLHPYYQRLALENKVMATLLPPRPAGVEPEATASEEETPADGAAETAESESAEEEIRET